MTQVRQTEAQSAQSTAETLRQAQGQSAQSLADLVAAQQIVYVDFPDALKGKYQSYTQADLSRLRAAGYAGQFLSVQEGVERYIKTRLATDC